VGGSYAGVSPADADWAAPTGTAPVVKDNGVAITFPTATGSWGTVTHVGFFETSGGADLRMWGALAVSKAIGSGDTASFPIGTLDVKVGKSGDSFG